MSRNSYSKFLKIVRCLFIELRVYMIIRTVHIINHPIKIAFARNQLKLRSFSHQTV